MNDMLGSKISYLIEGLDTSVIRIIFIIYIYISKYICYNSSLIHNSYNLFVRLKTNNYIKAVKFSPYFAYTRGDLFTNSPLNYIRIPYSHIFRKPDLQVKCPFTLPLQI